MVFKDRKPGFLCPAFLVTAFSLCFSSMAEGKIKCEGQSWSDSITRSDMAGTGSDAPDQAVAFSSTKNGTIINQSVDLDIQTDLASFADGQVTAESISYVWKVTATPGDRLDGDLTATYQFSSPFGINRVCSGPSSCLVAVNVEPIYVVEQRKANGTPNGVILERSEGVRVTFDLAEASDFGTYSGAMTITFQYENDPDGDPSTFVCESTTIY